MTRLSVFALAISLVTGFSARADEPAPETTDASSTNAPASKTKAKDKVYPPIGTIERLDPALDKLISTNAFIEKLAKGFEWAEGPVWDRRANCLYFSDVPQNVVFKWQPGVGTHEFILPSGYTGTLLTNGQGANGLAIDHSGRLILCQHGDRRIARLEPKGGFSNVAQYYKFRRFNSPNDLAIRANGDIYFTDPPYGLPGGAQDPNKEISFSGVYRVTPNGEVSVMKTELTFPNGIAFSPDEQTVYIAVSDPNNPVIMAYDVLENGYISHGRVFFNASALAAAGGKGLPDGLKVDALGNVWATGPGGVLIITPEGKHIGTLNTGEATANCAFGGPKGNTLYITADMYLCRVQTLTKGAGF